jgi:phage major head subunit gpT-like protein
MINSRYMANVFEKGKIKVVWIEKDANKIYSKMFNELDKALKFTENKDDFLVFSLLKQKNLEDFSWKLLPYGKHKIYKFLFKSYKQIKSFAK